MFIKASNNIIFIDEKPSSTIICERGNKFNINSNEYTIAEFNECSQIISGNVINRNIQCGNDGVFFNIGFNLPDSKGFVNLIAVCYSKKRGSAIFTSHVLYGKTIKSAMKSSARPSTFKTSEIPAKVSAPTSFTKAKQLERFSDIFGSRTEAEGFLNETYLARGHLTPDGDMIFVSWQWSTYYYLNVVPQFQKINNGNFKHIESIVRTKAAQLQSNLNIYTGAFDVLKLKNKKITLDPDGLEVPKWIWKIVKDEERDIGIAFVTLNNPYASKVTNICNDICNDYGWDWKDRKVFSKGYSICCSIADLKNVINYLPPNVDVRNVLEK